MSHKNWVSLEGHKQIVEFRAKGLKVAEISEKLGLARSTVRRHLLSPEALERKRERGRERWQRNKERFRGVRKLTRLGVRIDGKVTWIRVRKRPLPEVCELCDKRPLPNKSGFGYKFHWHHWDKTNPNMGLWLCYPCHSFVEGIERGLSVEKYLGLKQREEVT